MMGDQNDPGQLTGYAEPGVHSAIATPMPINSKQCHVYYLSLMGNDGVAGYTSTMAGSAWPGTQIHNCSKIVSARSGCMSYGQVWIIMRKKKELRIYSLY